MSTDSVRGPYRVLVTGSRKWPMPGVVRAALDQVGLEHGFDGLTVVHGACPTGADFVAGNWARENADLGVVEEAHPADWDAHGPAAGPLRNSFMVSLGADMCLAFTTTESRGTRDCMGKAMAADITTAEFSEDGKAHLRNLAARGSST